MSSSGGSRPRASRLVGLVAAAMIAVVYMAIGLHVHVPKDTGMFSDEWTYVMMAESLAHDGDLAYRAADLRRVMAIDPDGPNGVFLKPGVDVTGVTLTRKPPFFKILGNPDSDHQRLFFGKAYIYPFFAAPFVAVFGLNGFFVFNALLLAAAFLAIYLFIGARSPTVTAWLLAGACVLATVVPAYAVWMMPELFNFALGVLAYFFWLYKYVAPRASGSRTAWLRGPGSDLIAALLLGIATYSKVTDGLLFAPMILWFVWRRDWRRAALVTTVFGVVTAGLFLGNVAITGDWNYQGGPRNTFYSRAALGGGFPFQTAEIGFKAGNEMERSDALWDVILDRDLFWSNLRANLEYIVIGRYGGLLPYFFPTVLAGVMFLGAKGRRQPWQWLVLGGLVVHILAFIISQPYTYLGSGGSIGNRYFMGAYGMAAFLFPPVDAIVAPLVAWVVGLVFVGKILLHPFASSAEPYQPAKSGPLHILPIELTNLLGLPMMNQSNRKVEYGKAPGDIGFQILHFDDNAYLPDDNPHTKFWTRGKSRAEMIFKSDSDRAFTQTRLHLTAGVVGTDVAVHVNGHEAQASLKPGEEVDVTLPLGKPFIYGRNKDAFVGARPNYLWRVTIDTSNGFTPPPHADGTPSDTRFLGVLVKPTIWP